LSQMKAEVITNRPSSTPASSLLVVDDNSMNRIMLSRYLNKLGYQATLAENGRQAIVEGQPEQLKQVAHNLRGSSDNLGAHLMAALSAELETIGKNGTVEWAAELVSHLEQEYQRVCQALAAEIAGVK
jgi:HPt (histidine-containing phosphotransfer) domain-containing protein